MNITDLTPLELDLLKFDLYTGFTHHGVVLTTEQQKVIAKSTDIWNIPTELLLDLYKDVEFAPEELLGASQPYVFHITQ